ncbi:putative ribonuclease H-like domain-containing protein, partial [Tanacetum coccineum]
YSQAVKKLEAQLVTSQKQQLSLNEKLVFQANDDSLYVYGKKGIDSLKEGPQKPEISLSDDNSFEHSTCQSNDSEGSCGNTSEHSFETESESVSEPSEMSKSRLEVTNEKDVSAPNSKEVAPSCVSHIKTPRQPLKDNETHKVNRKSWNDMMKRELGEGYSFTKKKCFVCGSLSHLIKDCDYYEKKMAREAEVKRVVNTGNGVTKPVWTNANRINHSNNFVPRSVQLNTCRPKFNSVRPNINTGRTNISSGRPKVNSGRPKVNSDRPKVNTVSPKVNTVRPRQPAPHTTSNSMSPKRPQMDQINQRRDFSTSYSSVRRPFAKSTAQMAHTNAVMGSWGSAVKSSASYNWRNSRPNFNYNSGPTFIRTEHPLKNMVDRGIFDSGCSGHMTGNKDQLEDFEEFNGGSVTFGGSKGYISGKGRIRVGNLDFDSVSFVKELGHFNLFSISQICDKQHKVLFTETECLVVSSDFKMPDENQILLKVPRHHNMYSFDMKTPSPAKGFACLIAKATSDESKLWHRRLGHINFKNLNKLVKGNLVRGLPSKVFKNDHTCVACHKGKQHRASCKAKLERLITKPLHTLHMDLFGPTSVRSINHASYCLVITDDCTRFCWVFFLASKDETSGILQTFIRQIENQLSHRVKIISVLGKFDGKSDEGFLVGYSLNSKAYRVYNLVTKRVEVNLHVNFLEDKPNVKGVGYRWMFDIDYLTDSMNYIPVSLENQANPHAGASEVTNSAGTSQTPSFNASEEKDEDVELIVVPSTVRNTEGKAESRKSSTNSKKEEILTELQQEKKAFSTDTSEDNPKIQAFRRELEEIALKHLGKVSENTTTSTTSVNTGSEPVNYLEGGDNDFKQSSPRNEHRNQSQKINNNCLFACFSISWDPKKIVEALQDASWVQAMHKRTITVQASYHVGFIVDLPHRMKAIGTKWVYRNKRDERGVVVRNKARLVAQGYTQEEGIDYDEVVKALYGLHQAPRAWYATLFNISRENGYKWVTIDKIYSQKRDKKDIMLVQVYVDDIIFGSTNKSWCDEFEALMKSRFQMSSMGELTFFLGLQVKQNKGGIFISQDKYVAEILKKFDLVNVKAAITPMETKVPLTKDEEAIDVDVTPKTSHLNAVKRIFKYLKGKPHLGLWYPRESPFDLEAFSDSDYGGSNLDRKSTTGGCQFLGQAFSWNVRTEPSGYFTL